MELNNFRDDPWQYSTYPNRAYSYDLNSYNWTLLKGSSYHNYNNPQAYIYQNLNGSILLIWSNITNQFICFGIAMSDEFDKPFYHIGQMNNEVFGDDGYFGEILMVISI